MQERVKLEAVIDEAKREAAKCAKGSTRQQYWIKRAEYHSELMAILTGAKRG
jgi:hypothetical protein